MFRGRRCAWLVLWATVGVGTAQAANLVENGGFETGSLSGWTVSGDYEKAVSDVNGYAPRSGSYYAELGDDTGKGELSQTISDQAGTPLTLTYYVASFGDTATFSADWDGSELSGSALTNPNSQARYEGFSFSVLGEGTDVLAFHAEDKQGFLALDDVSLVSSVPLPASAPMFGLALLSAAVCGYGVRRLSAP